MELARLTLDLKNLDHVVDVVNAQTTPVIVATSGADAVMIVASLGERLRGPIGAWIEVSAEFSAPLAARDVATLSWLVQLDHVIISATSNAASHAEVVRALLTDDEVNFANNVATLRAAYNRPAPPRPVAVWSWDGAVVRHDTLALVEQSRVSTDAGELTFFA